MSPEDTTLAGHGADPRGPASEGRASLSTFAPRGRPLILIADDDDAMRALVRDILRGLEADFEEAASGLELITCLADRGPYTLVVTDVRMPWMSGVQGVIAARNAGLAMPFIVMTAFGSAAVQQLVDSMAGAVLLSKPFSAEELRANAMRLLGRQPGATFEPTPAPRSDPRK